MKWFKNQISKIESFLLGSLLSIIIIYWILIKVILPNGNDAIEEIGSYFNGKHAVSKALNQLNENMDNALISHTCTIDEVEMILNSVDRDNKGVIDKYGKINALEYYISHAKIADDKQKKIDLTAVKKLILELKTDDPYYQLNDRYKYLMKDLDTAIKKGDINSSIEFSQSVKQAIIAETEKFKQEEQNNSPAVLSFIFGAIAIISFMFQLKDRNTNGNTSVEEEQQ